MSLSVEVFAVRDMASQLEPMIQVLQACSAASVSYPPEVVQFFGDAWEEHGDDADKLRYAMQNIAVPMSGDLDSEDGACIQLDGLPEGTLALRIVAAQSEACEVPVAPEPVVEAEPEPVAEVAPEPVVEAPVETPPVPTTIDPVVAEEHAPIATPVAIPAPVAPVAEAAPIAEAQPVAEPEPAAPIAEAIPTPVEPEPAPAAIELPIDVPDDIDDEEGLDLDAPTDIYNNEGMPVPPEPIDLASEPAPVLGEPQEELDLDQVLDLPEDPMDVIRNEESRVIDLDKTDDLVLAVEDDLLDIDDLDDPLELDEPAERM